MPDQPTPLEIQRAACALKQVVNKVVLHLPSNIVKQLAHVYTVRMNLDRQYQGDKRQLETEAKAIFVDFLKHE